MAILQSDNFDTLAASASNHLRGQRASAAEAETRLAQWRREEWHNWFRWRLCRKGFDWSKPIWIAFLALGFAGLWIYGTQTGRLYVTAAGVVAWFTVVNLSFFTYFGLTLPGPPRPVSGPFQAPLRVSAKLGIYPAGYERRNLARVLIRISAPEPPDWLIELTFQKLPDELTRLMTAQATHRMQRGAAPATEALVESIPITREQIDAGEHPLKIIAWRWDEQSLEPFNTRT